MCTYKRWQTYQWELERHKRERMRRIERAERVRQVIIWTAPVVGMALAAAVAAWVMG